MANYMLDLAYIADSAITKFTPVNIVSGTAATKDPHVEMANSAGEFCLGIAQFDVTTEHLAKGTVKVTVRIMGVSKAVAGDTFSAGARLQVDTDSRLITAAADDNVVGIALQASAADGEWVDVLLTPGILVQSA